MISCILSCCYICVILFTLCCVWQAEKAKHFLYEAKYGRFGGLGDPLHALQRDSELNADSTFDESAVKAMYDDQLTQLDNLITTQHHAQQQMREQLGAVDKRLHKVLLSSFTTDICIACAQICGIFNKWALVMPRAL